MQSRHQHNECCLMVARHLKANGSYCTTEAKAAVAELNALGLNYTLSNGARKQSKAAPGKGKDAIKAAACPICEFQSLVKV
jgi:hypothetical protein